jgi:hypothetical protein
MTPSQAYAVYATLAVACAACEFAARRRARGRELATLSDVVSLVMRSRVTKVLVLAGWLWLGWHLFVRGTHG